MKPIQREMLVQRLLANYRLCSFQNVQYVIRNPSVDILYKAQLLYEDVIHKCKYETWLSEGECERLLLRYDILDNKHMDTLKFLEQQVENLKVDIYRQSVHINEVKKLRDRLRWAERQVSKINELKHHFDPYTLEYFAQSVRSEYIILNTLYNTQNELLLDIDESLLNGIIQTLRDSIRPVGDYRLLARTDPWMFYWRIGKPNPFSCFIGELNDEQKNMIVLSSMYDVVWEHSEKPSDLVIEDDDMLDGWFILQRRENKKKSAENQMSSILGEKYDNAGEVFIPAGSIDDLERINTLNDVEAQQIKRQRFAEINKAGEIKEADLLDKKLEIRRMMVDQAKTRR